MEMPEIGKTFYGVVETRVVGHDYKKRGIYSLRLISQGLCAQLSVNGRVAKTFNSRKVIAWSYDPSDIDVSLLGGGSDV